MKVFLFLIPLITFLLPDGFGIPGLFSHTALRSTHATPTPGVVIPGPDDCRVEPRTVEGYRQLKDLAATPMTGEDPRKREVYEALPAGKPADEHIVAEITVHMNQVAACGNARDFLRAMALFTDDFILRTGPTDPDTLESLLTTTPEAYPPSERIWIAEIRDVLLIDDGRVSAIVTTAGNSEDAHPAPGRTQVTIFARVDGRLLVDETYHRIASPDGTGNIYVADAVATPQTERATPEPSSQD